MKKAFQLETAKNLNHDCKLNGFRRFSYPKEAGLALGGPGFSPFVMLEVFFLVSCLSALFEVAKPSSFLSEVSAHLV